MNPSTPISVTEPVRTAIEHVKAVLFRPFDISRWFTIGFCAWLAWLGEGGGGGVGGGGNRRGGGPSWYGTRDTRGWLDENLLWLIPAALGVLLLVVAIGTLVLWLSSRGKFMFLHCVVTNRAEVKVPWHQYAGLAHSVFLFRLALFLGSLLLIGLLLGVVWATQAVFGDGFLGLPLLILAGLLLIALVVVLVVVAKFTTDFVVPILYLRGTTCFAAWQELLGLIQRQVGIFVLYLLFQIVLTIGVALVILAVVLATCCVAGCLLAIPYLGAVLLLPVFVFDRAYSLHFLRQFGPEYDLLLPPADPLTDPAPATPPLTPA